MQTHSVEEATAILGAPSTRWVTEQLRAGRFQGYKVGRTWRMTDRDIEQAIEEMRPTREANAPVSFGLSRTSRRRLMLAD